MIRVLTSFPTPRRTTNPYIVQLFRALQACDDIEPITFSWVRALTRRIDVFHAHWPEILVGGRPSIKKVLRQGLFVLMLLRFRWRGTAIVRTVHNLHLPADLSRIERWLLTWFDRRTDHRVVINPVTPLPDGQSHTLIQHGHYRDWFAEVPKGVPVPGRLAFVGLIRRYKGTEGLVHAFRDLQDPQLSLTISGNPSSDDLVADLISAAEGDPRIRFRFEFLDDTDLVATVTEAELVVLPYRHMHNSGGALTALSLDRPVLLPDNEVNRRLAHEVGPGWVQLFTGHLDDSDLRQALDAVRAAQLLRSTSRPNLSARDWATAGSLHAEAYTRALSGVRATVAASRRSDDARQGLR